MSVYKTSMLVTSVYSLDEVAHWKRPPFQRAFQENSKVRQLAEEIAQNGGVIPGVLTLGLLQGESVFYLVDGQHRVAAFKKSGMKELWADVRTMEFASMADMATEFLNLNSSLVRMRPDDLLRSAEVSLPLLAKIMKDCPFVTYGKITRGASTATIGMSQVLRAWNCAGSEACLANYKPPVSLAEALTDNEAESLIQFLTVAYEAWGRDKEYGRLWGGINLALCMWLWRRLVTRELSSNTNRYVHLNVHEFTNCMRALSADSNYIEWLYGRLLRERDRGPAYTRIRKIWTARLKYDGARSGAIKFPAPDWYSSA